MRVPRALVFVAIGIALVGVDFRTSAIDLLPDPIGWILVTVGAYRLGAVAASALAAVAGVLSLVDVYLGFGYDTIDPVTGDVVEQCPRITCAEFIRYDAVGPARATAIALAAVIGCAALVVTFHVLRHRLPVRSHTRWTRPALGVLQLALPVVWAAPIVVGVGVAVAGGDDYAPVWTDGAAYVSGATTVVVLAAALTIAWLAKTRGRSLERDAPSAPRPFTVG